MPYKGKCTQSNHTWKCGKMNPYQRKSHKIPRGRASFTKKVKSLVLKACDTECKRVKFNGEGSETGPNMMKTGINS